MADTAPKKSAEKVEAPTPKAEPAKLGRASESGDAGVQNLLAQRSGHAANGHKDKVAEIDAQLAELGLTAQ